MRTAPLLLLMALLPVLSPAADTDPIEQVHALIQKFVDRVDHLPGYEVVMIKQQRISGTLKPEDTLLLKQSVSPDCRYMKWIADPHKGRELILCPGRYGGKLQVHESGILGVTTLSLDPNGSTANSGNLRPISQAGIYHMAATLKADQQKAAAGGDSPPPQLSERVVNGRPSSCFHGKAMGAGDQAPYPVGAVELCFDKELAMPTEVQFWNQDGELMEHYRFKDWNLNPGLTDADFDTANKAYNF